MSSNTSGSGTRIVSRGDRRWRTFGLAIGSVMASLVALELLLHLFMGNLGMPRYDIHPADGRCVGLRPDTAVPYTGWFLRVPEVLHDVNHLGYRGEPRTADKPSDLFRILLIGDSFVYGQSVRADETVAAYLERLLHERSGQPVEVLNFGIPGLNLEEDVGQYVHFASRWRHDLVLLAASDNDLDSPICDLVSQETTAAVIKTLRLARLVYFLALHPFGEVKADVGSPSERLQRAFATFATSSRAAGADVGLVLLHGKIDGAPNDLIAKVADQHAIPQLWLQ